MFACALELARRAEAARKAHARRHTSSDTGPSSATPQQQARLPPLPPDALILDLVLLGAPVTAWPGRWRAVRSVVSGRIVNAYCRTDAVLRFAYRAQDLAWHVAGVGPVGRRPPARPRSRQRSAPGPAPTPPAVPPPSATSIAEAGTASAAGPPLAPSADRPEGGIGGPVISSSHGGAAAAAAASDEVDDDEVDVRRLLAEDVVSLDDGDVDFGAYGSAGGADDEEEEGEGPLLREEGGEGEGVGEATTAGAAADADAAAAEAPPLPPPPASAAPLTTTDATLPPALPAVEWAEPGIENVDVTALVSGHLDYRRKLEAVLAFVGLDL